MTKSDKIFLIEDCLLNVIVKIITITGKDKKDISEILDNELEDKFYLECTEKELLLIKFGLRRALKTLYKGKD